MVLVDSESDSGSVKSYGEDLPEDAVRVTRSIMIVKPPGGNQSPSGSAPASPAGSTPPVSPFSGKVVLYFFIFLSVKCRIRPWIGFGNCECLPGKWSDTVRQ